MKKAIALILVLGILAGGFVYLLRMENQDKVQMKELYAVVEPLQRERDALVAEKNSMETDYALQMRDIATAQLLFLELRKEIFTDVYPQMREHGVVGVLGINMSQYPDRGYNLTSDEFKRLLQDGWGTCLIFEDTYNFDYWYSMLSSWLERDELPVPKTIFFPDNTYDKSLNASLLRAGINTIIRSAGDARPNMVTIPSGSVWYTESKPWNYTGVNVDTDILARTSGGNVVFTMSFKNLWDAYEKNAFANMLLTWETMKPLDEELMMIMPTPTPTDPNEILTPEEELLVPYLNFTTFEAARSQHKEANAKNVALASQRIQRETEIDNRIEELDAQIRTLYEDWSKRNSISISLLQELKHE